MKKLLLFVIPCMFTLAVQAQKIKGTPVPRAVQNAFEKQYPNTKAKWEKEKSGYEASFKQGEKNMSVIINENGTIIETETAIAVSALPAAITGYVKQHYKREKIKEAAVITDAKGVVTYEAGIKSKDLLFDSNGKFIKAVAHSKEDGK
jgi:hypothetical protein